VVGPLLDDPVAAREAITALRRYSLITQAGDGLVLVHRLVQAAARGRLSAQAAGQWDQAAAALVEEAVAADPDSPGAWPAYATLLPHARALLPPASDGMRKVMRHLGLAGAGKR
jgi:hypothetical protein